LHTGCMVSLTERSFVLYADVGGVCLDGLAQRLCLWGYTRSSPNIHIGDNIRSSLFVHQMVYIRSSYICSYMQFALIVLLNIDIYDKFYVKYFLG